VRGFLEGGNRFILMSYGSVSASKLCNQNNTARKLEASRRRLVEVVGSLELVTQRKLHHAWIGEQAAVHAERT
jgi:hypothetical protein